MYTRGSTDDWDRYANLSGDSGWSWNAMQHYFKKSEHFNQPVDHHDTSDEFDPAIHGFRGPLFTTLPGDPTSIDGRVVNATEQLGGEHKLVLDYNDGNGLGIGE